MKLLPGGCCVFSPDDGEIGVEGSWTYRTTICRKTGARHIAQIISHYQRGRSPAIINPVGDEVLYVVEGRGRCRVAGFDYDVEPGAGVYVPAGARYSIENEGAETLVIVSVGCPEDDQRHIVQEPRSPSSRSGPPPRRLVHERDRPPIRAGSDREFKLMVDQDLGCRQITQFIGFIPPSKAPFHYHTYEEAIFILDGHGLVHAEGGRCEFGPGTSIYLPIGLRHCLENPGPAPVRLLGVFYPSGSPAVAYENGSEPVG